MARDRGVGLELAGGRGNILADYGERFVGKGRFVHSGFDDI
jgi:hypothetical protein